MSKTKTKTTLVVNDGPRNRFTAAGRLVPPGGVFDESELNTAAYVAKTAPVGTLTDEQLLSVMAQRGLTPNPGAPEGEPAAAPVAPQADPAALEARDEERKEQLKDVKDVKRASDVIEEQEAETDEDEKRRLANLDRDKDGQPGGSLTKAQIAAELTDLKVEFDPNAKRDDLGRLLDKELAKSSKA